MLEDTYKLKKTSYHFWIFPISKLISSFGALVYAFAISLYILQQTGSATSFALSLICSAVPRIAAAPLAGYVADNFSRKLIVLIGQMTSIIAIGGLLAVSLIFELSLFMIYITTAMTSIASTFSSIALSASITRLFDDSKIQRVMSINQICISFSSIGSPVIAGMLYGYISISVFLIIYLVTSFIAIMLISTMDFHLFAVRQSKVDLPKESMWQSMKMGVSYLKSQPIIMTMVWVVLFINFLLGAFQVGYTFTLIEIIKMETQHFGFTEAAFATGMLLMSIWLAAPNKAVKFPILVAKRGIIGMGIAMIGVAMPLFINMPYKNIVIYYVILMLIMGLIELLVNIPLQVMLQKSVDDNFKGRVLSLIEAITFGLVPLGSVMYGYFYDIFPAQWILIMSGLLLISLILVFIKPSFIREAHPELSNK